MSTPVVLPAEPARRGPNRPAHWWGRAWVRAVEEAAYGERDLATGRRHARSGRIGRIAVRSGGFAAGVEDDRGLWAVSGTLPVLDREATEVLVEVVAAEPGRRAALLGGDLPLEVLEHAEELGVELLPSGGELASSCSCQAWTDPCPHALAVMLQLGWQLDADALLLLHLRGLPREELLDRLPADPAPPVGAPGSPDPKDPAALDLDVAEEAALRARRLLGDLASGQDSS